MVIAAADVEVRELEAVLLQPPRLLALITFDRKHSDASLALRIKGKVEEDAGAIDDGLSAVVHLNHNFVRVWINFGSGRRVHVG